MIVAIKTPRTAETTRGWLHDKAIKQQQATRTRQDPNHDSTERKLCYEDQRREQPKVAPIGQQPDDNQASARELLPHGADVKETARRWGMSHTI